MGKAQDTRYKVQLTRDKQQDERCRGEGLRSIRIFIMSQELEDRFQNFAKRLGITA